MKAENSIRFMTRIAFAGLIAGGGLSLLSGCGETAENGAAAPDANGEPAAGMVRFQPEFPPEQIEGTPEEGGLQNVEPIPSQPPTLPLPADAELLSAGKPVTASDDFIFIGDLSFITDGNKRAGEGYYVELEPGQQWVQIDLEQEADIHGIWVWHYHRQERAYRSVAVQISNDENFESGVTTVYNNDYENNLGFGRGRDRPYLESRFGKPIRVDGVRGRYVRLYSDGNTANDMNHYIEVQVYGIPAS